MPLYTKPPPLQHSEENGHKISRTEGDLLNGESGHDIDLRDLFLRLYAGLGQIIGLALLGAVAAIAIFLATGLRRTAAISTRVNFTFDGLEHGEYPDHSKFQADDLRAPAIIAEALKQQGVDSSAGLVNELRNALVIEAIIPAEIVKERDRLRSSGQPVPVYTPDEYVVTLSLPARSALSSLQQSMFLTGIVNIYRQNFLKTYAATPIVIGNAFTEIQNADFPEYELIFHTEMAHLIDYLSERAERAKSFRSPTTNLSFGDLLEQTAAFEQIRLNGMLAIVDASGIARNRAVAVAKMNYSLKILNDEERHALDDEKVVKDLLAQAQSQTQNYVLGVKSQASQTHTAEAPATLDQGLIDSLLANDAYNLLVRRALDAGLHVKQIEADRSRLTERIEALQAVKVDSTDQTALIAQLQKSLADLKPAYLELVDNVRKTQADYTRQQFADVIRMTDSIRGTSLLRTTAVAGIAGGMLGLAAGVGLSFLGIHFGSARRFSA